MERLGHPGVGAQILPEVAGLDVIDLGCGTATGACVRGMGARPTGLDVSEAQLETARAFQTSMASSSRSSTQRGGRAAADSSFDLAFSEYGAALVRSAVWIPEAHRLLPLRRSARLPDQLRPLDPLLAAGGMLPRARHSC